MKHLVYILFLFAAVACSTTPSSSGLKTITLREVQSKPAAEVLQQEELNASVKMIPLETNDSCLLGAVEQLVDAVCLWVVSNSQIYQFDHTGKFIKKLGRKGQGPGEYLSPYRICADPLTKTLYVLDFFGRKTLAFDYEGNLLYNIPLPKEDYSLDRFAVAQGKLLYSSFYNSVSPDLFACDLATGKLDTISFRDREMGREAFIGETFIYPLKGATYLYHYFNDTVYAFDGTKLTPHYLLDIGSYKYSFAEQEVVGDFATKDPIEGVRIQVSNFFETADYLFLSYTVHTHSNQQEKERDTRLALYDKQNETMHPDISIRCADHAYLSLKGNEPVFASVDEHSLYISKYPADLLEEHDIPDLDAEDNPVLIRYTFDE